MRLRTTRRTKEEMELDEKLIQEMDFAAQNEYSEKIMEFYSTEIFKRLVNLANERKNEHKENK